MVRDAWASFVTLDELCKVQVLQLWKHELISRWDQVRVTGTGTCPPPWAGTPPALLEALLGSGTPVSHCPAHPITLRLKGFEKC